MAEEAAAQPEEAVAVVHNRLKSKATAKPGMTAVPLVSSFLKSDCRLTLIDFADGRSSAATNFNAAALAVKPVSLSG